MTTMTNNGSTAVSKQFGITIALLIPGFIALWPFQHFSPAVAAWFHGAGVTETANQVGDLTTAGFLMVVLASLTLGMLVGGIRWALLDWIHEQVLPQPNLDYSTLQEKLDAFDGIMEAHYRYYQYYTNMSVGLVVWLVGQIAAGQIEFGVAWASVLWLSGFVGVQMVLFFAAQDARKRMIEKLRGLLGETSG